MFTTLRNAWKIEDLRKKLLYTLLIIVIFRLGVAMPVPFLDASSLSEMVNSTGSMTLAIEPMVNAGAPEVRQLPDGWGVKTKDGSLSAHFERSIAITAKGPVILTDPE